MNQEKFEKIGKLYPILGEETIRKLVDDFYDIMDSDPTVRPIRNMHSQNLEKPRKKLFMFLVGRFGGPPLFVREYGHPRLKARHYPFKIGEEERDQWLHCMRQSLQKNIHDQEIRVLLDEFFTHLANFMINQPVRQS